MSARQVKVFGVRHAAPVLRSRAHVRDVESSRNGRFPGRDAEGSSQEPATTTALRAAGIRPKLVVGAPGDAAEREADRVADVVSRARVARASWSQDSSPTGGSASAAAPAALDRLLRGGRGRPLAGHVRRDMEGALEHDLREVRVHTGGEAAASARSIGARAYTRGSDVVFGGGEYAPHSPPGRRLLAHELAHVVQNERRGTSRELIRRDEQEAPSAPAVPAANVAAFLANPPLAAMSVTLSGLKLNPPEKAKLAPGSTRPQLMAVVLRALLGGQYDPKLVPKMLDVVDRSKATVTNLWVEGSTTPTGDAPKKAEPGAENADAAATKAADDSVPDIFLDAEIAVTLIYGLKRGLGLQVALSAEQEDVLVAGLLAIKAWAEIELLGLGPGNALPVWYTKFIFDRQMASRANELTLYGEGLDLIKGTKIGKDAEADDWRAGALNVIVDTLNEDAAFVEAIRRDTSLVVATPGLEGRKQQEEVQAAVMYRELWEVPDDVGVGASRPTKAKDEWLVSALVSFGHSQPAFRERAIDDGNREAHVEMLVRFGRFTNRITTGTGADETLRTSPAVANAPPFPSVIGGAPALPGPLFQAPLEAERRFLMKLEFQNVYEAFSFYNFRWQLVPVKYTPPLAKLEATGTLPEEAALKPGDVATPAPQKAAPAGGPDAAAQTPADAGPAEPSLEKPPSEFDENAVAASIATATADLGALDKAEGEDVSNWDLLRHRYARAVQYHREDMQTVARELGPAGSGAADLATVNAIMRYAGAGLGTLIDALFERQSGTSSEKIITFPKPGLYVVRCIGTAVLGGEGEEELVRAPSVAYHPVFVRPAEEIAAAAVYTARSRADDESALKTEIEKVLGDAELTEPERKMLTALHEDITTGKQGVKATLELQLSRLKQTIEEKEGDKAANAGVLGQLGDEKDRLEELLRIQRKRGLAQAVPLRATFVGDDGQTLPLQMEANAREPDPGKWKATVSDLTTINSGKDSGAGATKDRAVLDGVQNVLESGAGYGRGIVAVELSGKIETVRIAADVGQIAMEGIENLTTLLSIAAIAAAPFTGGATLTLLIPIGAVGAIPSVYRLVTRAQADTLRWDLNTAMDLVNIVGAAAGAGQMGVGGKIASATAKGVRPGVWTIRAGKGLMVIGLASDAGGAVLLGGGIIQQLNALAGLPEGERKARMFQILGGALLQAGITVGGSLAAKGVELQNQQRLAALADIRTRPPAAELSPGLPLEKTPKLDVSGGARDALADGPTVAKARDQGVDPALANATKVTDAPDRPQLKAGDTATPKVESETPGKTTTGTKDPAAGKAPPSDVSAAERAEADPLRQALAKGEDSPTLTLPPLHTDRTSATIPPDFTWASSVAEWPHAMQRYWEARAAAPGREVGVWRNASDGTYAVTVGTGTAVNPPQHAGDWSSLLHYHPNPDNTTRFQMPAPHDFAEMMLRFQNGDGKISVREFVDYGGPGQRQGRTEYGITAGDPMPFYVTTTTPGGEKVTLRFKDDGHFRQEWGGQEVFVGKQVADAMKADLDRWLANMRQQRARLDPPTTGGKTTAGTAGGKREPRRIIVRPKTTSDTGTSAPAARVPLTDGGRLTPGGRDHIRRNIKKYADKSDIEIDQDFANHGAPHELIHREEMIRSHEGIAPDNPNAYLITKGYRGRKGEPTMAGIVSEIYKVAKKAKRALTGDPTIVKKDIDEIVGLIGDNATKSSVDPDLQAEALILANHPDSRVRAEFEHFYFGEVQTRGLLQRLRDAGRDVPGFLRRSGKGWGNTKVGKTRPDATELHLGDDLVALTDFTHRYADPVHNFKLKVYRKVVEKATGLGTTGNEYRGPLQQTPDE